MALGERWIWRGEGSEDQATQVWGDARVWAMTKCQVLIQGPQLRGPVLLSVALVITKSCTGACGRDTLVFKGLASLESIPI